MAGSSFIPAARVFVVGLKHCPRTERRCMTNSEKLSELIKRYHYNNKALSLAMGFSHGMINQYLTGKAKTPKIGWEAFLEKAERIMKDNPLPGTIVVVKPNPEPPAVKEPEAETEACVEIKEQTEEPGSEKERQMAILKESIDIEKVAERFGVSPENVATTLDKGKLAFFDIFGKRLVRERDLSEYVRNSYQGIPVRENKEKPKSVEGHPIPKVCVSSDSISLIAKAVAEKIGKSLSENSEAKSYFEEWDEAEKKNSRLEDRIKELEAELERTRSENSGFVNLKRDYDELMRMCDELEEKNEKLEGTNTSLKAALESLKFKPGNNEGLLKTTLNEFYEGEYAALFIDLVQNELKNINSKQKNTSKRRTDLLLDIVENNKVSDKVVEFEKSIDRLPEACKPSEFAKGLLGLGFIDMGKDGKHSKYAFRGDNRYVQMVATSPSDARWASNAKRQLEKTILVRR